jgi:dCMP deaminase
MDLAIRIAQMSHAKRNKVGCVIVKDKNIISYGFNGMPTGFPNECEEKDINGNLITKKEVLHSELNAISKAAEQGTSTKDATLYVTLSPCIDCARLLIQSGIKKVFYKELYRDSSGIEFLKKSGIKVYKI